MPTLKTCVIGIAHAEPQRKALAFPLRGRSVVLRIEPLRVSPLRATATNVSVLCTPRSAWRHTQRRTRPTATRLPRPFGVASPSFARSQWRYVFCMDCAASRVVGFSKIPPHKRPFGPLTRSTAKPALRSHFPHCVPGRALETRYAG